MDDLIEVRVDESFDPQGLASWLEGQEGLPRGVPIVRQFAGGKANLTYLLVFPDDSEMVLRRPPLGPVPAGSHDMAREYRVLSRLWQSFPEAPRAFSHCEDETVIGSQFLLMERRHGVVVRDRVPETFGGGADPDANRKLSTVVIDTLAEFHAVDPARCGLDTLGHPEGFLERQVDGWATRWERAQETPYPVADEVAGWLRDRIPHDGDTSLLHNDWRLDNMAVDAANPGICTAVYDWDMATRGDPLADVGTLMASWYDPGEERSALSPMPTDAPGWLPRGQALERYGQMSGRSMGQINWYVVFGTWKLGVVLQQIYIRWLRGQTQDERFRPLGEGARALFRVAAERRAATR